MVMFLIEKHGSVEKSFISIFIIFGKKVILLLVDKSFMGSYFWMGSNVLITFFNDSHQFVLWWLGFGPKVNIKSTFLTN